MSFSRLFTLRTATSFLTLLLIASLPNPSRAQSQKEPDKLNISAPEFEPNVKPNIDVTRADGPIVIDGEMNEAAWKKAGIARNFSETFPGDQTKPPVGVTVYSMYDESNFYLFYKIEDDPNDIRVHISDRDAIWQDDYVGLILDTNGDGATQYFIASNPIGIQGDTRISRNGEDASFDLIYHTAAKVTETGYQVEFAIPFRSLRFPEADIQKWSGTFWITRPRSSRNTYSWAAIDRDDNCFTCQFGTLTGMQGVKSGKNLEILPSLTTTQYGSLNDSGDPSSGFKNQRVAADPSLNVKYGITSDLTADLAVNPDFSQIEADAAQIDVNSTFALFYREQRPFFQEGADLFDTWIDAVYTRSINDPILATKLTGRFGRTSVAYIGGRDDISPLLVPLEESSEVVADAGKSYSNIVRVQHNLPGNSFIGALATDRRMDDGGSGSLASVDALVRFGKKYQIEAQFAGSHTIEPNNPELLDAGDATFDNGNHTVALDGESFSGFATYTSLERDARYWTFDVDYWTYSPNFRTDNGFVTQNDNKRFSFFQGVTLYPKAEFVDRIFPRMQVARIWNFDNVRKDEWAGGGFSMRMKRQTNLNVDAFFSNELFRGTDFRGLSNLEFSIFSNCSNPVQAGFYVSGGKRIARNLDVPEIGNGLNFGSDATIRPTQRLVLSPSFEYSRLTDRETGEEFFSGYILRMRTNYQFTRRLFARVITQYNHFSERLEIDPLVTYKINAFSAVYVGSTHDLNSFERTNDPNAKFYRQSSRQLFLKLQYLVRR